MGIFKSAKDLAKQTKRELDVKQFISKEVDFKIHEKVLSDLAEGKKEIGVWGKAIVEADGDEKKAEAKYIKLMVQYFKDIAKNQEDLEKIWEYNYDRKERERIEAQRIADAAHRNQQEEKRLEKEKKLRDQERLDKPVGEDYQGVNKFMSELFPILGGFFVISVVVMLLSIMLSS